MICNTPKNRPGETQAFTIRKELGSQTCQQSHFHGAASQASMARKARNTKNVVATPSQIPHPPPRRKPPRCAVASEEGSPSGSRKVEPWALTYQDPEGRAGGASRMGLGLGHRRSSADRCTPISVQGATCGLPAGLLEANVISRSTCRQ